MRRPVGRAPRKLETSTSRWCAFCAGRTPAAPLAAALVCRSFAQHATTCLTAAVALVPVTTVALSVPVTTAVAPARAYAQRQRWIAAEEALG